MNYRDETNEVLLSHSTISLHSHGIWLIIIIYFFYHITLKFLWCSNQRSFIICFW